MRSFAVPGLVVPSSLSLLLLAACSGAGTTIPDAPDADARHEAGAPDASPRPPEAAPSDGGAVHSGSIRVHLAATTAAFSHPDAWAGQTPSDQRIGIRSLSLGTSADDPAPWVVFDHGGHAVDAGLNDGDDTLVATIAASSRRPGHYAYAKVGVDYVRYAVAATVHEAGFSVPGTFHNLEVLSDGTVLGGKTYASGYYSFAFTVGSQTYGPVTGLGAPLPMSAGLGIALSIVQGKAAYGFPVSLDVESTPEDVSVTMTANTDADFRWKDESLPGYTTGAFDVSPPTSYEPVEQFGANALTLSVAPTP